MGALEKSNALSRMLQRELLAAPQGAGRGDIDGDGGTDCGKEDNEEGENGDEEGRNESGGGGEDVDVEEAAVAVTVGTVKAPTKRRRGTTTRKGGRTRAGAE